MVAKKRSNLYSFRHVLACLSGGDSSGLLLQCLFKMNTVVEILQSSDNDNKVCKKYLPFEKAMRLISEWHSATKNRKMRKCILHYVGAAGLSRVSLKEKYGFSLGDSQFRNAQAVIPLWQYVVDKLGCQASLGKIILDKQQYRDTLAVEEEVNDLLDRNLRVAANHTMVYRYARLQRCRAVSLVFRQPSSYKVSVAQ